MTTYAWAMGAVSLGLLIWALHEPDPARRYRRYVYQK